GGRRIGRDQVGQRAAAFWRLRGHGGGGGGGDGRYRCCAEWHARPDFFSLVPLGPVRVCLVYRNLRAASIMRTLSLRLGPGAAQDLTRTLFVEPDRSEILIDVMARADLPAFHIAAIRHDPVAP